MSFKKKLLSTAMAVAMASGFAISQNASAIHLAEDGVGQLLLAPYYSTLNGYQTKFAIYNTRDDVAVKVKVVIRSQGHSIEGRDFICYLTPADVCRFELVNDGGQAWVTSSDDSVRNTTGGFAYDPALVPLGKAQSPLKIIVSDEKMKAVDANDNNEVGHVEFIGAYAVRVGTHVVGGQVVNVTRGMLKSDLAKIFDRVNPRGDWDANSIATYNTVPSIVSGVRNPVYNGIVSDDPSLVQIAGEAVIVNSSNGNISDRAAYRIPALAGDVGSLVISNDAYDVTVRAESPIGQRFGYLASDNIYQIEEALAASHLKAVYDSVSSERTGIYITFPTKYRHRGATICPGDTSWTNWVNYTHPFDTNGTYPFSLTTYDNFENIKQEQEYFSPSTQAVFPAEVNFLLPNWFAAGGYYDVNLVTRADGCAYNGVPVLSLTHKYVDNNGVISNSMLIPTTHQ
ncbi:MAG: hypothetical protein RIT27_995 [Pseudomonadota bacterium]